MRVAPAVVLSPEERVTLERWAARSSRGDDRALRARLVLAAAQGAEDQEIARRLRIHRRTVARWRANFLIGRLPALEPAARLAPRPRVLPERAVRELVRTGRDATSERRPSTREIARRFGISHSTVRRVWQRHRIEARVAAGAAIGPDPRFPLAPLAPAGLFLRAPDHASVFLLSSRLGPGPATALFAATPETIPSTPPSLMGPPVPGREDRPRRTRALLRFLAAVDRSVGPERDAEILAHAPGLHLDPILRRWALDRPNLRIRWLPDERRWREMTLEALTVCGRRASGTGRSPGEIAGSIRRYLASFPNSAMPFEWTARRSELDRDSAAPRLRYELSSTGHPGFKSEIGSVTERPPDPRYREMARVVLRRCLRLRRGELLAIETWSGTLPAANALTLEAWRLGARPALLMRDEPTYWAAVRETRPEHLARVGAHVRALVERSDALVTFFGPSDRERIHALPFRTRYRLGSYDDELFAAAERGRARAVQLALGRVSEASARMYAVDAAQWREEVVRATAVDPRELHRRGTRVAERLRAGRTAEISHPNGTRLRLGLSGRPPQVVDGITPRVGKGSPWAITTLPAGVVSVALDERCADGFLLSNVPETVGVYATVGEFEGGRWTFRGGRLTRFSYARGSELFAQSYETAGPGRDRPGVLSIGLNDRISTAPLLLDQAAGTLTLQIGRNLQVGGTNRIDWWAWLLLRGGDLRVDGRLCVRGGRLVA